MSLSFDCTNHTHIYIIIVLNMQQSHTYTEQLQHIVKFSIVK